MKNEKFFNLIERILIVGPAESDLDKVLSKSSLTTNDLSNVHSKLLEEYRSINLIDENDVYTDNINMFCFPENVKILQSNVNVEPSYYSFTIISKNSKRKFCTCLMFYESMLFSKQFHQVSKVICIISPIELFNTTKEILNNIYSIIFNHKNTKESKINQSQLCYVYIKDETKSSYKSVIKEYKLLEFYFGFLLNSLKLKKEERSYFVRHIGNNMGKKAFLDFHINSKSFLKIKDFDLSMVMDLINVENLIKIYIGMLMEYKVILVFENYEAINKIIFALLSLLFPMKWKLPIISYALEALIDSLEAPFGMICGLHAKFLPLLKQKLEQKLIGEETLVFNLATNSFIFAPEDFPELPRKITNELKSNFYLILSEKLSINNGIRFANAEYSAIFPDFIADKVDAIDFLNLKFSLVFVNCFLEIIRNLEEFIDPVKLSNLKKQANTRIIVSDLLDLNKLYAKEGDKSNNPKFISFLDQLTKTIMFTHFFEKYLTRSDKNYKYKTIKSYLKLMNSEPDNYKTFLNDYNKEKIRNKMINYYDYKYISLEAALKKYLEKAETSSFTSLNSNKPNAFAPKLLWNKLDVKKINIFNLNYETFLIAEQDEFVGKSTYRTILSELLKKRDSKAYELGEEENVDRPMINNNETKLKSHLEIIQANKRKKKDFPSLSLDDKTLYDIYESGLDAVNNTFSSKNKINFQRNFENVGSNEFRDSSKEPGLFPAQHKFSPFFFKDEKNFNIFPQHQNIYVNNINITNNFNNLTLNSTNGNSAHYDARENPFFTAQGKSEYDKFANLSSFNDISNFTYSEKASNKSVTKGIHNVENNANFLKSEILNVSLHAKNNRDNGNISEKNNNISNLNDFNFSSKKNFVNSEIRNSLNLSSFNRKSFSPLRNADTVIQNKLVSRNKLFCESGGFRDLNVLNNKSISDYGLNQDYNNNKIEENSNNNKTQYSDNSNTVNVEYSNKNLNKNFDNNNDKSNHSERNSNKININNPNYKISNGHINNVNTSPFNLTREINLNNGKTATSVASGSDKSSSTSSNNKINLKLIPNVRKINYPNFPNHAFNNNSGGNNYGNYYRDVGNSPNKNSIFLDFLDKSKNIQTNYNHNNNINNTDNNFILNSSSANNNNNNVNYLNQNNVHNPNYKLNKNNNFDNSKNFMNNTKQISSSRLQQLNESVSQRNDLHSNLNLNKKNFDASNTSLSEARNFQLKLQQTQQQLNLSKMRNEILSDNFGLEAISPSKRNSEVISFAASAQGKKAPAGQVPANIKLQLSSKLSGISADANEINAKKIEATNPNLEIIKRLSGDDDKDVFGD